MFLYASCIFYTIQVSTVFESANYKIQLVTIKDLHFNYAKPSASAQPPPRALRGSTAGWCAALTWCCSPPSR